MEPEEEIGCHHPTPTKPLHRYLGQGQASRAGSHHQRLEARGSAAQMAPASATGQTATGLLT